MSEEESYPKYMIKGSSIAFIALILTGVFGLAIRLFMSRALAVQEYGLFYAVFSFISFLTVLRSLGQLGALNRYIPKFLKKKKFSKLKSSVFISLLMQISAGLGVGILIIILSPQIATRFFGTKSAVPLLRILSVWYILMTLIKIGETIFQAFKDIPSNRSVELLRMGSVFLLIFFFSYIGDLNGRGAAFAYLGSSILTIIWIMVRLSKFKPTFKKGTLSIEKSLLKELFLFGLPLIFSGFAGMITSYIDTIAITFFKTSKEVALYQVARPATRILQYFGMAISIPLFPMISELWTGRDFDRLKQTIYYITKFSFLFMIPGVLIFLAFPDITINLLFGSAYVGAATTLQILSLTMISVSLFTLLGKILVGTGKNVPWSKVYASVAILNLVGDLILVPFFGAEGAAFAFLTSHIFGCALSYHHIRDTVEISLPYRALLKMISGGICTLLLINLVRVLPLSLWPKLFLATIIGGFFYLIWILRTKTLTEKDFQILKDNLPIPSKIIEILRQLHLMKKK